MKNQELKKVIRDIIKEEMSPLPNEPKKNIDKLSDVIVQLRSIEKQIYKNTPKAIPFIENAIKELEKAQNIV